jgi:hypothetical protein
LRDLRTGSADHNGIVYDRRNSELYNDMISRGRRLEQELGVETGGRRARSNQFIKHDTAIHLIYGVSMAAWLVSFLYVGL